MGAVLSGVRRLSHSRAMDNYNRERAPKENRPIAALISRDVSPNASSYERSRKFRRSIDTSKEDRSSYEESGDSDESESFENVEKKRPSSHSSDTSYGARSLPEFKEYDNWRRDYKVDDENWIRAVRAFNRRQKTWKRIARPARSLRRMGSAPTGLKWTKCAREVYKREPASEWVVVPDPKQELALRKYKRVEEEIDHHVDRLARLTLDMPFRSSSFSSSSTDDDDDVSTAPERSKITTSSDDEDMTSSSDYNERRRGQSRRSSRQLDWYSTGEQHKFASSPNAHTETRQHTMNYIECLLGQLEDRNTRDDQKLKVIEEIWNDYNGLICGSRNGFLENLTRCFLKLFSATSAQFITQNNTQMLRKTMLEILLRTSGYEAMGAYRKQLQTLMIRVMQTDNEVNAGLAIRILIDHLKLAPPTERVPVAKLLATIRRYFNEVGAAARSGRMFEPRTPESTRRSYNVGDDVFIEMSLQKCFQGHQLNLGAEGEQDRKFNLIPRAGQSVNVLGETVNLIILIMQYCDQDAIAEIVEITKTLVTFTNTCVPAKMITSEAKTQELYNDFHSAQVKALGYFTLLIRSTGSSKIPIMETMVACADRVISGLFLLLETCPDTVISHRKELLTVSKIFASYEALRVKFLPFIPAMFSEQLMIGPAFTAKDCLRKMMYEQLMDLLNHLRSQLSYPTLCHAAFVSSRCLHDPLLPTTTQTISIRLIPFLCDSFIAYENMNSKTDKPCRDVLVCVLESIIYKLRVFVVYHMPLIFANAGWHFRSIEFPAREMHAIEKKRLIESLTLESRHADPTPPLPSSVDIDDPALHCEVQAAPELEPRHSANIRPTANGLSTPTKPPPEKGYSSLRTMYADTWSAAGPPMALHDARIMVRSLISSFKHILAALRDTRKTDNTLTAAEEREMCSRMFKYGLQSLDIFNINPQTGRFQHRLKDDKDVYDTFAGIFATIHADVFNEILTNYMPFLVERIIVNPSLQLISNVFFNNAATCTRYIDILIRHLMDKIPEMTVFNERSNMYLRLFKLAFSSVHPSVVTSKETRKQVEKVIKPWIHQMIRDALHYALRARDPTNLLLLLRPVIRTITLTGDETSFLFQEYQQLMPSVLSFLSRNHSRGQGVALRDLQVEMCISLPIRLSSLSPHIPILMKPLITALADTRNIARALNLLQLCIENLPQEFLGEHLAPIRPALTQSLWRVVHSTADSHSSRVALRILGRFGNNTRKMLAEPQPLKSLTAAADLHPLCLRVHYDRPPAVKMDGVEEDKTARNEDPIVGELCLSEAVKTALETVRGQSTYDDRFLSSGQTMQIPMNREAMRQHATALCKKVLMIALAERGKESDESIRNKLKVMNPLSLRSATLYRSTNEAARSMYINALSAIALAVTEKDQYSAHIEFLSSMVRQLTMQALMEHMDPPPCGDSCMDGLVVVDVMTTVLADPFKEYGPAALMMMRIMCETCVQAAGDVETFCALPLIHYSLEKMTELCYDNNCLAKLGGTKALAYIVEELPRVMLRQHLEAILRALVETIVGLANEISLGANEIAAAAIDRLMVALFVGRERKGQNTVEHETPSSNSNSCERLSLGANDSEDVIDAHEKIRIRYLMAEILVPLLDSADTYIQKTAVKFVSSLASLSGESVLEIARHGGLSRMCGSGLCDFPGLSLWKQLGVLNAVEFASRHGVLFEFPPQTDEHRILAVYVDHLTRICRESSENLLSRKTYLPVGTSSPTIPHSVCAEFIREGAMRGLCLAYALLPGGESVEGLQGEKVLRLAVEVMRGTEKGMIETAKKGIQEAHELRPFSNEVIKLELNKVVDGVEKIKELSNVNARLLCSLMKLKPALFDERCFNVLMMILRAWDEKTRKPASVVDKLRTTAFVEALESVIEMLPLLPPQKQRAYPSFADLTPAFAPQQKIMEEWEEMEGPTSSPLPSRFDPSDLVPLIASLASTMHAVFCIPRTSFFSSGCLVEFLAKHPMRTFRFFLSADSLLKMPARRSLFKRVFEAEGARALRAAAAQSSFLLMRHMLKLHCLTPASSDDPLRDGDFKPLSLFVDPLSEEKKMEHELLAIWMIDVWSRNDVEAYCRDGKELVTYLQGIWRSDAFKKRYMVHADQQDSHARVRVKLMTTAKCDVPKLFAACFVRYLRENSDDLDLFTDLLYVFVGDFVTDFSFVRNYLASEVIPSYSLKWRRDFFAYVLSKFENEAAASAASLHIARVIQYALAPVLQYAFERFEPEEILGPNVEPDETVPPHLVIRLTNIITAVGKRLSDTMTLAFYHLNEVIINHAPAYIHPPGKRGEERLRVYMLFAWPCLTSAPMDVSLKYAGHLYLCHIIRNFTINRKIVLQVYNSLTSASQQDNRDVVKKALDMLTPHAAPLRTDDGEDILIKTVRKALCEQDCDIPSVFHCIQTVTRNYKTYFKVRFDLLPMLLEGFPRLTSNTSNTYSDGKRLTVEVCEMVMKWAIMRNQNCDEFYGKTAPMTVDKVLERLKRVEPSKAIEAEEGEVEGAQASAPATEAEKAAALAAPSEDDLKEIPRESVNTVVNILFRIATMTQNPHGTSQTVVQQSQDMCRRCISLLRAALKQDLWGGVATVKIAWLEKQLTITEQEMEMLKAGNLGHLKREQALVSARLNQAAQTIDVLQGLMPVMPKELQLATIRPLQKAIISCFDANTAQLTRSATTLVSRLMDYSSTGLAEEYGVLSAHISLYMHRLFDKYMKYQAVSISMIFPAFNLLRAVCKSQPSFLDTCLVGVIRVLMRAESDFKGWKDDVSKEKMVAEICDTVAHALELIRLRLGYLTNEQRRQLANLANTFCETISESLLELIIRTAKDLIESHRDDLCANHGLTIVVKLSAIIKSRFRTTAQSYIYLTKLYLQELIVYIFEHDQLRRTDQARLLEETYYWGLTNPILMIDDVTRNAFLRCFEKHVPSHLPDRLVYIFSQFDWTHMQGTFWIKHALYLLIRCALPTDTAKWKYPLNARETATFGATMEWLTKGGVEAGEEEMREETAMIVEPTMVEEKKGVSELLEKRRKLQSEVRSESNQREIIDHLMGVMWTVQEPAMARALFIRLLTSICASLNPQERHELQLILPYFLSSSAHVGQATLAVSSLAVVMEALTKCQPPFEFAPALVKYVSSRHRTVYLGMRMLEEEAAGCETLTGRLKEVAGPELHARFAKQLDALESLNALYMEMNESDQQHAVWKRRAFLPETVVAVEKMAKGEYVNARHLLEDLQMEQLEKLARISSEELKNGDAHFAMAVAQYETDAWARMHTECLMNLGQWKEVEQLASTPKQTDVRTLMRAASHRLKDPFDLMRKCKQEINDLGIADFDLPCQQYSALIAVMDGTEENSADYRQSANREAEIALMKGICRWKLLPEPVGVSHLKLLQMLHMVHDLSDASAVTCSLHPTKPPFSQPPPEDMENVSKMWINWSTLTNGGSSLFAREGSSKTQRSPCLHDDLPVTAEFLNIRKLVAMKLERCIDQWVLNPVKPQHIPLPSQSIIHTQTLMARSLRSARLYAEAEQTLIRGYSDPSLLSQASVAARVVEHTKLLRVWANDEQTDATTREALLKRGLQVTSQVDMSEMSMEFFSRIYAQRGLVLSDLNNMADAQKTFEIAGEVQGKSGCYAYGAWAKHLERVFLRLRKESPDEAVTYGVQAILAYLEVARMEQESKARRAIARIIWLGRLLAETGFREGCAPNKAAADLAAKLDKAARNCSSNYWIEWLPQLGLNAKKWKGLLGGFAAACARDHPIHSYYAMRQQIEEKDERMSIAKHAARNPQTNCTLSDQFDALKVEVKRDPSRYVSPTVKDLCRFAAESRPSDILAMERLLRAIEDMKDVWAERQLRTVIELQKELFQCLHTGQDTAILSTPTIEEKTRIWRERLQMERFNGYAGLIGEEYIREIDIRRSIDERLCEPIGEKEEITFLCSFSTHVIDILSRSDVTTIQLAEATVEWRKALEQRIEQLPKSIPLRLASPFLSTFCAQTAIIDVPEDMIILKNLQYMSTIARFGPHYQIGVRGEQCVKCISILAQNGKTSLYFVRKTQRSDSGTRSRMPQLMRALDYLVQSDRGTCQRFLKIIPPVIVNCGESELVAYIDKKECGFFLNEVLLAHLSKEGMRADELVAESEKEKRRLMERSGEGGEMREGMSEEMARMEVYRRLQVCVPSDILLKMVQKRVPDATYYYLMRKSLVTEWAVHAGLEFALHLKPSTPSSILVDFLTGRSANIDCRIDLTKDERVVPFRLTDNMERFMEFTKEGHFASSLQATLGMLHRRKPELYLRPIVGDCVAEEHSELAEVNEKTMQVIEMIKERVRGLNDANGPSNNTFELLKKARDVSNLSRMPTYFLPHF